MTARSARNRLHPACRRTSLTARGYERGTGLVGSHAHVTPDRVYPQKGRVHDRMPMTVRPDRWDAWLDPELTEGALDLLDVPGAELEAYAVSRLVSTVGNDGPELIEPVEES